VTGPGYFGRFDSARMLALGGVALAVCGMLLGEIYAIYISHIANGLIKQNWSDVIQAAVAGDRGAITDRFAVIESLTAKRGRTMNTHSHLAAFGLLALLLALLQPYLGLAHGRRQLVAGIFLVGACLQFGGVYLAYYAGDWVLYVADLGAALVIVAIAATLLALRTRPAEVPSLGEHLAEQLSGASSRYLLKSGLILILAGMSFGLYYAWQLVTHDEPAVYSAVDAAVSAVVDGDTEKAATQIAGFKRLQSKIAITAAAHSHAVEFGFLMLLLAFVQGYVLLSAAWRLRWARVLSVGAFLLPVCVYMATHYGLRAAAFADLSGSLVLLALLAMGVGLLRQTGVMDSVSAERSS
jgi:hypothetical protein